jgi:predicted unusual protein kinase regulating ubiquinone biosynthesis (AarF/ABC1/UbiB family)
MAMTAFRSGRMVVSARGRDEASDEDDLDLEQLASIIGTIGRLKGVAMKMGQIMSYIDIAIPDELKDALSVLQTHAQPMPFEKVRALVMSALPDTGAVLLKEMEETPISSASIGQVHRSRLPDGTRVAVKVQYPEVADAIAADFGPASFGTRIASLFYPNARIDDFVKEARERFLEECDYLSEAHCQNVFRALYRDHEVLMVPEVHRAYCSQEILTSTFVAGIEFDELLRADPSQETRDRIGRALFEFYLGSLFRHQIYNCDPHPGNYIFLKDGRVAMLDHGCTRQFAPAFVAKLANLTRAVHADSQEALHRALIDLNMVREGKKYDYQTIRGFLRSFFGPMLVDEETTVDLSRAMEMREVFKKKRQLMKFSLPGEFMFLFRIRFGLMSVLSRLGTRANWFQEEKRYVNDFVKAHPLLTGK